MRLQPQEIDPSIVKALTAWQAFSSDTMLQDKLIEHSSSFSNLTNQLNQAVIFWSTSSVLKEMIDAPDILNRFRPTLSIKDETMAFFAQAEGFNNSSIIFRTYVSVVLGRSENLVSVFNVLQQELHSRHLGAVLTLLRNAISHGTYHAHGNVLDYWDNMKKRRISFPELDELNFSILKIVLMAWSSSAVSTQSTH